MVRCEMEVGMLETTSRTAGGAPMGGTTGHQKNESRKSRADDAFHGYRGDREAEKSAGSDII